MLLVGAGLVVALAGTGGGGGRDARPTAVQIVVTRSPIAAGAAVRAGDLATVAVPQSFAMRGAVVDPASAVGARAAVALPAGAPLMAAEIAQPAGRADDRDVAIRLDSAAGIPAGALAGARADLYATTSGHGGRTRAVLRNVLVVSAEDGEAVATLRVPERVVPMLVAAEGGSSLRLVVRAPEEM
jgi:Flp pilus assembly protein CpaB